MLSFLIILLISLAIALGASMYWEKLQEQKKDNLMASAEENTDLPKEAPTQQQKEQEESDKQPDPQDEAAVAAEEKEKEEEQTQEASSQPVTQTPVENTDVVTMTSQRILESPALVPNSGFSVSDEYFDDVAFVGDSITEGIKLYEIMNNSTVVAARGINLDTVFSDDQIRTAEGNTTVLGALEQANPKDLHYVRSKRSWMVYRRTLYRGLYQVCSERQGAAS